MTPITLRFRTDAQKPLDTPRTREAGAKAAADPGGDGYQMVS